MRVHPELMRFRNACANLAGKLPQPGVRIHGEHLEATWQEVLELNDRLPALVQKLYPGQIHLQEPWALVEISLRLLSGVWETIVLVTERGYGEVNEILKKHHVWLNAVRVFQLAVCGLDRVK